MCVFFRADFATAGLMRQVIITVWLRASVRNSAEMIGSLIYTKARVFLRFSFHRENPSIPLIIRFMNQKHWPPCTNCSPINLNKTFCGAPGSSWRPTSNFSLNYKTNVSESDLVLLLYSPPPWSVKTMKWKKYVLLLGQRSAWCLQSHFHSQINTRQHR